jgi:hypothetical protein
LPRPAKLVTMKPVPMAVDSTRAMRLRDRLQCPGSWWKRRTLDFACERRALHWARQGCRDLQQLGADGEAQDLGHLRPRGSLARPQQGEHRFAAGGLEDVDRLEAGAVALKSASSCWPCAGSSVSSMSSTMREGGRAKLLREGSRSSSSGPVMVSAIAILRSTITSRRPRTDSRHRTWL